MINRYKMAKPLVTDITDDGFTFRRNDDKIAAEQRRDGIYIVRSDVEPERFDAAQTVRAYKDLSKVERAFRYLKSVDLRCVKVVSLPANCRLGSQRPEVCEVRKLCTGRSSSVRLPGALATAAGERRAGATTEVRSLVVSPRNDFTLALESGEDRAIKT